jgi:hypothetical protein
MTLDEFLKLESEDKESYIRILQTQIAECTPSISPGVENANIIDIDHYYDLRFEERKLKPEISWPTELSKRERIICKSNMLIAMLERLILNTPEKETVVSSAVMFVKSIIKDSFTSVVTKTSKKTQTSFKTYEGIPPAASGVLNAIYEAMIGNFQKQLYW